MHDASLIPVGHVDLPNLDLLRETFQQDVCFRLIAKAGALQDADADAARGSVGERLEQPPAMIAAQFGQSFFGQPHFVEDRKSTRLNSSHVKISYAVFCLKKKN